MNPHARDLMADLAEWFTPEAQARVVAKHIAEAEQRGRDAERAKVVAWLRADAEATTSDHVMWVASRLADEIEAGEHTKEADNAV